MGASPPKTPNGTGTDTSSVATQAFQLTDDEARLPANEILSANINYLGSSYSGTDIKVVVNLYAGIDQDQQKQLLQDQLDDARDVVNKATALIGANVFEFFGSGNVDTFLSIVGDASSNAITILSTRFGAILSQLQQQNSGLSQTKWSNSWQTLANDYQIAADAVQLQLTNFSTTNANAAQTLELGTLQTLSVQTFREKNPVRALGESYVKGYTRGPRSIAGSMIFTIFNEHSFAKLLRALAKDKSLYGESANDIGMLITDQLPPIDLTIVFVNEYGSMSSMALYGVEFFSNGMTMSIEDLLTEEVCQFVCRAVDPMISRGNLPHDKNGRIIGGTPSDATATSLLIANKDQYSQFLAKLKVQRKYDQ